MRNSLLATALVAGTVALSLPAAAQFQSDVTVGVGAPLVGVIPQEQVPVFRRYVVEERVPSYRVPDRVVVGTTLPEAGVVYYDVPERYGATTYRYTVVNDRPVLVDPRSRRIMQVID